MIYDIYVPSKKEVFPILLSPNERDNKLIKKDLYT